MFAYCLNNPVNMFDRGGDDAIVLLDEDGVGHLGLLVQDVDGNWKHYYWGSDHAGESGSSVCILPVGTKQREIYTEYTGEIDLKSINQSRVYSGDYEKMLYLSGDFTEAFEYLEKHSNELYNLYKNNCSQHSLNALASCDTTYSEELKKAARLLLPKKAFRYIDDIVDQVAA